MSNNSKKPLSKALKLFYGVGDCGFTLMSNVESYFFNFFLTNLASFDLGIVTAITTISSTVDACLSWIYGAILNSIKPKKWGRYRSWLVLLPWIVPFLYAFQFIKIGNGIVSAVIVTVAAIASHVVWNFPYVANVSMISVAGATPDDRAQLSSTRAAWANFSKIIFSYVGVPLASVFAGIVGETNQYGAVAFVLAWVMVVLYFAHFKMFDGYEEVSTEDVQETKKDTTKTSGMDLVRALLQNPPLIALMIADLSKWAFNFIVSGIAMYYFTYVAKDAGLLTTYILISNIFCVVGSYLAKSVAKKFSTRTGTIGTFILMAAVMIAANFLYTNVWLVVFLMSLAQLGYGIAYACTPALYSDTIIYSEWKTGKNATGWISGLQNVPLKVGVMLRGISISACLAIAHFTPGMDASQATVELQKGICLGFMIIPACALLLSAVILLFGFKITREKVEQYRAEIDARRA
ncbi:Na+/melibiose symporter and related transporter [Lachnoclostridium sp. An196]|uniref:MFS transporter n=1 Tax=Lachnoclostridium sp. An196 TaxID=1965583 RepID=UPI000B372B56|nr:MFS transporter [Lachnoclostridium sp. An196]OUP22252.1 Na+/melibiose symporter and related transporter [Lachnoclostridium sp. An196]HIS07265.1 MFS transporter [Candidatus Choladocola avistercoris]